MNTFQENILDQMPQFTLSDFTYFLECSRDKVQQLPLDANCTIHQTFIDSSNALYHRAEYCLKNCGFKCLGIPPGTHNTTFIGRRNNAIYHNQTEKRRF